MIDLLPPKLKSGQAPSTPTKSSSGKWLVCYFLVLASSFVLCLVFLWKQLPINTTLQSDALGYIDLAELGIPLFPLRTYGYSSFLAPVIRAAELFHASILPVCIPVLIAQWSLYATAAFAVAWGFTKEQSLRLIVVSSLLLNVAMLPYLSVSLTESLSVVLLLACIATWISPLSAWCKALVIGILSGYAVEVRVANVWMASLWFILQAATLWRAKLFLRNWCLHAFMAFGLFCSLAPQLAYNWILFKRLTPFPAVDIASLQFQWGQHCTSVAFALCHKHVAAFASVNPFTLVRSHDFQWLSIDGLSYLLLKCFSLLLYDNYYVYARATSPFEYYGQLLFTAFCVWFGIAGIASMWAKLSGEWRLAVSLGIGLWMTAHTLTAMEDRFSIYPMVFLFPFGLLYFANNKWKSNKLLLICFPLFFLFINLMSAFCLALAPSFVNAVKVGAVRF